MHEQLKDALAGLLCRPRALKPQTQRQLESHWAEQSSDLPTFFECAADVLAEHELEILFGPMFTPTLDERAELAESLALAPPDAQQLRDMIAELAVEVPYARVQLPDGAVAKLKLHEVMIDRFVRLLRLDAAAEPALAARLRRALPAEPWSIAVALMCDRGMTAAHQEFFAAFIIHAVSRHDISSGALQSAADFIARQPSLDHTALERAADALMRATQSTTAFAAAGHNYWSPDVAQHHHYRGQGNLDEARVRQRQTELENVTVLVEDLKSFFATGGKPMRG